MYCLFLRCVMIAVVAVPMLCSAGTNWWDTDEFDHVPDLPRYLVDIPKIPRRIMEDVFQDGHFLHTVVIDDSGVRRIVRAISLNSFRNRFLIVPSVRSERLIDGISTHGGQTPNLPRYAEGWGVFRRWSRVWQRVFRQHGAGAVFYDVPAFSVLAKEKAEIQKQLNRKGLTKEMARRVEEYYKNLSTALYRRQQMNPSENRRRR